MTLAFLMVPAFPLGFAAAGPAPQAATIPTFTNVTATAGVGALSTALPPAQQVIEDNAGFLNGGKGGAWFDYNRDGLEDLFVTGYYNRTLFRNNGDGTFTDVTAQAGVGGGTYTMGVITPDFNNDGWPDLALANWWIRCEIFINQGDGSFLNVTSMWNFIYNGPAAGLAFGDIDGDGWGDLYIGSYYRRANGLFRNLNGGGLEDVAAAAGVQDTSGNTFQPMIFDYDRDGDLDIFDANDFGPDALFRNDGNWSFTDVSTSSGVGIPGDGMGAALGDANNDGYMDIFVTNFDDDYWWVYNPATSTYTNKARDYGINDADVGWGVQIQDFNNDGLLDVFIADGRVIPNQAAEVDKLFLNQGNDSFVEVAASAGVADWGINRGSAAADYNNDGRMDLWVSNVVASSTLYNNTMAGTNAWLEVKLEGVVTERDGVGARVTVTTGNRTQARVAHMGSSYLSQDTIVQHFGLGGATVADEVVVEWPSGVVQRFVNVTVNQRLSIREWEGNPPSSNPPDVFADAGAEVVFDGSASTDDTGINEWRWNFTGTYAGLNLTGRAPPHTFYFPGNFTATLTVTDTFGNSDTATFNLSIRPVGHPLVSAGPDATAAEGATLNFSATLEGLLAPDAYNNTTFLWKINGPPGNVTLSGRNISYTFTAPGTYAVRVTATDQFGMTGNDTVIVRIGDTLAPVIVFTPPANVNEDTLVTFDASATHDNDPAFTQTGLFYWTLNGPTGQYDLQVGPVVNFSMSAPGINRFTLSVNDSFGNVATLFFVVFVSDITPPVSEAGAERVVVRAGTSVRLDASSSTDNDPLFLSQGFFEWVYDGPDGPGRVVGITASLRPMLPGQTTVRLHVLDPSGNPSAVDDILIIDAIDRTKPVIQPIADATTPVGVPFELRADRVTDNDPNFPFAASFQWTLLDGPTLVSLSGRYVNYTYTTVGRWPVTLNVADPSGNGAATAFNVTVEDTIPPEAIGQVPPTALAGDSIALNATGSRDNVGVTGVSWVIEGVGASANPNGAYILWTFVEPGNYTVTLTVADASGNKAQAVFHVEVQRAEPPVVQPPPTPDDNATPPGTQNPALAIAAVGIVAGMATAIVVFMLVHRRMRP